jgi:hypothetical protein
MRPLHLPDSGSETLRGRISSGHPAHLIRLFS